MTAKVLCVLSSLLFEKVFDHDSDAGCKAERCTTCIEVCSIGKQFG